jgi:hypothetical protein
MNTNIVNTISVWFLIWFFHHGIFNAILIPNGFSFKHKKTLPIILFLSTVILTSLVFSINPLIISPTISVVLFGVTVLLEVTLMSFKEKIGKFGIEARNTSPFLQEQWMFGLNKQC